MPANAGRCPPGPGMTWCITHIAATHKCFGGIATFALGARLIRGERVTRKNIPLGQGRINCTDCSDAKSPRNKTFIVFHSTGISPQLGMPGGKCRMGAHSNELIGLAQDALDVGDHPGTSSATLSQHQRFPRVLHGSTIETANPASPNAKRRHGQRMQRQA